MLSGTRRRFSIKFPPAPAADIHHLRVYDNSAEADPAKGEPPRPVLLLEMKRRKITVPADLSGAPDWAQPIFAAAIRLHTLPV